jgi:imidazolonepropionase-like amidohydrolase
MKKNYIPISCILVICLLASAGFSQVPAAGSRGMIALVGATVVTVSGEAIENGSVLFENGKILAIGNDIVIPENATVYDVSGRYVYPAMIHARSSLGLTEVGRVSETVDLVEFGNINPNVRIQEAYNSASEHVSLVRTHGIAITLASPMGGIISGTSAAMLTDGWTWETMTYQAPVAMMINWPDMLNSRRRDEGLKELQQAFDSARRYMHARQAANHPQKIDVRWEAMIPVLEGKIPVHIFANEITQIQAAINWAERENLKMVLVGARDAAYAIPQIRDKNIPVILTPVIGSPSRPWEAYDHHYSVAGMLHQAGISFCIAGEASAANVIRLKNHAAAAVAYGLDQKEALKAITLSPAQILGLDDRMGSIEVGKDASLVVADGDLLEFSTQISQVFIMGREVDMMNKHRRLYKLYQEKFSQIQESSGI